MHIEEQDLHELLDDLGFLIAERQDAKLRNIMLSMHPSDIAELVEQLDKDEDRSYLFNLLDAERASEAILELDDVTRESVIEDMGNRRLSELVDEMASDDAADIVSELDEEDQEEILQRVEDEDEREVRQLLEHREDSAGGIMALEIVSVAQESTVDQAIAEIRNKADEIDEIFYVYVVDDDGKLIGLVNVKDLILSRGKRQLREIMSEDFVAVPVKMDQEEVANIARKYDLVSVPVVDDHDRLLGRITIDDIVDVMEEEATEDFHKMAGLTDEEEARETSTYKIVRTRIPWLVWGLVGGLIGAGLMSQYEHALERKLMLTYFVPVIMAMAGNIGIQSSAIVVRGLATGEIVYNDIFKRCWREIKVALLNGLILAILLFIVVAVGWYHKDPQPFTVGFVIGASLLLVIVVAGAIGTTVPMILRKMNIDPALATGPFITTSNDIIGLFIYLSIGTYFILDAL